MMRANLVNLNCWKVLEMDHDEGRVFDRNNFLEVSDIVRDVINNWPAKRKADNNKFLKEFIPSLRKMRDEYEGIVKADPMCLYRPKHQVALNFHKSLAEVRYFYGGNRTSKSTSGIAEVYWTITQQHPYRPNCDWPIQVAVVGTDFTKYRPTVFEPKYLYGEGGDPLSPVFPEGGKWFYAYDRHSYCLSIACPDCAEAGKAQSCAHEKSRIYLFSDNKGASVMAGAQYALMHFDEQIGYELYREARERITTVKHSGIIITETPIKGKQFWTWKVVKNLADSKAVINGTKIPVAEAFHIDQFSAGLIPHDKIMSKAKDMSESEFRTRVLGEPMVDLAKAVFDPDVVIKMEDTCSVGTVGTLVIKDHDPDKTTQDILNQADYKTEITFETTDAGMLTIWEPPAKHNQYVIGVDVAHGLTQRDASVADIFKLQAVGSQVNMVQVAQYYGWINPLRYAEELFKLGLYYKSADKTYPWLVIERNGPGMALIQHMVDMGCWFLFQDIANAASVRWMNNTQYGIDTNIRTKSIIIAALQSLIKDWKHGSKSIIFRSAKSVAELANYIQEPTQSGMSFRFQAEGAGNDDCVMSAAMAAYAVKTFPLFDFELDRKWKTVKQEEALDDNSRRFWKQLRDERKLQDGVIW